jgi:hypothetical protein
MPLNGRRRISKDERNQEEMNSILREMYSRGDRNSVSDDENKGRDMSYITEMGFTRPPDPVVLPPK